MALAVHNVCRCSSSLYPHRTSRPQFSNLRPSFIRCSEIARWWSGRVVCAAASAAGSPNPDSDFNPYEVLGVSPFEGFDTVNSAYAKRRKEAEIDADETAASKLEKAYDKIMMSQLTCRKKGVTHGSIKVSKDIKYADKQPIVPWGPRFSKSSEKDIRINLAIAAVFRDWEGELSSYHGLTVEDTLLLAVLAFFPSFGFFGLLALLYFFGPPVAGNISSQTEAWHNASLKLDVYFEKYFTCSFVLDTAWIVIRHSAEYKPLQFLVFAFVYRLVEKLKSFEGSVTPTYSIDGEDTGRALRMSKRLLRSLALVFGCIAVSAVGYTLILNLIEYAGGSIPVFLYNNQELMVTTSSALMLYVMASYYR